MADAEFLCRFIDAARSEDMVLGMTVRTFEVAHIFDETQDGDIHEFRHFQGFFYDEGYEFLRRGDDEDAVGNF